MIVQVSFDDFVVMMGPAYYARKNGANLGDVEMTYLFYPTPHTLHPTPCTLHPTPYAPHHTPHTRNPKPET